jgi:hypothetical protein
MKSGVQESEFRIQNNEAETAFTDSVSLFFWILLFIVRFVSMLKANCPCRRVSLQQFPRE